jgi:hypothetical protein
MDPLRLEYILILAGGAAVLLGALIWWILSCRKTPEERERERRTFLKEKGRITDGTIHEVREIASDGRGPLQLLIFSYDVAGVSYEASQDVTLLQQLVDLNSCRHGLPTSVKYDPQNPANSIVVAEGWSGLRHQMPTYR